MEYRPIDRDDYKPFKPQFKIMVQCPVCGQWFDILEGHVCGGPVKKPYPLGD